MNVVWYRLRVSESQRHTPIKMFPSTPPPGVTRDYNELRTTIYRKPTHTDRLLDQSSYNPNFSQGYDYTDPDKTCATSLWLTDEIKYLDNVFNKNNYNHLQQLVTALTETPNRTLRTLTRHLSLLQPYLTSKGLLKLSHDSYNPTTSALLTNLSLLYDSYWRTLKTKTNRAADGEQFIRSNDATARPLILVRPAGIWTSDWLNTNERLEMVISTITLLSTI